MGLHTSELVYEERGRGWECIPGVFDWFVTGHGGSLGGDCEPGALCKYMSCGGQEVAFGKVCDPLLKAVLAVSLAQHVI